MSAKTVIIDDTADDSKYLLFRLGGELYGTPLLGVREVIQPLMPKAVPNTVPHFLGLINIRGQIAGVVELRRRFDYVATHTDAACFLVFDTETGPIAALVDKVEAVVSFPKDQLLAKPNVRSQIPAEFLIGAATHADHLVTLIDLQKSLTMEDYIQIANSKLQVAG